MMFPYEKMQKIVEKHWSEMMEELDELVDIDYLDIDIKLKYENEYGEGFELQLKEPKEV